MLTDEDLANLGPVSPRDIQICDLTSPCQNFEGPMVRGYGRVTINGNLYIAHRFSYSFHRKVDIKSIKGLIIRHLCHNPSCFNPLHLASGDGKANREDDRKRPLPRMPNKHYAEDKRRKIQKEMDSIPLPTSEQLAAARQSFRQYMAKRRG